MESGGSAAIVCCASWCVARLPWPRLVMHQRCPTEVPIGTPWGLEDRPVADSMTANEDRFSAPDG
jgi:hypothetical protein